MQHDLVVPYLSGPFQNDKHKYGSYSTKHWTLVGSMLQDLIDSVTFLFIH